MAIKLFFFDLEGTIFSSSKRVLEGGETAEFTNLWSLLMHELGPAAVRAERHNLKKWKNGEYHSYLDWARESAGVLKKYGLNRETYLKVTETIPYNPGVKELLAELNNRDIRSAVISGGFANHARKAQRELHITHSFAAIDLLWNENGRLDYWNILPSDYEGKIDFVRLLEREYNLSLDECAFVGDEKNDVFIAREVGLSFAYNAPDELKEAAGYAIEDLGEIPAHL
ncbi:MAG: HAD family hydrolase [bacterium]